MRDGSYSRREPGEPMKPAPSADFLDLVLPAGAPVSPGNWLESLRDFDVFLRAEEMLSRMSAGQPAIQVDVERDPWLCMNCGDRLVDSPGFELARCFLCRLALKLVLDDQDVQAMKKPKEEETPEEQARRKAEARERAQPEAIPGCCQGAIATARRAGSRGQRADRGLLGDHRQAQTDQVAGSAGTPRRAPAGSTHANFVRSAPLSNSSVESCR